MYRPTLHRGGHPDRQLRPVLHPVPALHPAAADDRDVGDQGRGGRRRRRPMSHASGRWWRVFVGRDGAARRRARGAPAERGLRRSYDVYTPYAVHGLDEAHGAPRSRLPWVTLAGGLAAWPAPSRLQVWCRGGRLAAQRRRQAGQLRAGLPAHHASSSPSCWAASPRPAPSSGAAASDRRPSPGPRRRDVTDDALVLVLALDGGGPATAALRELLRAAGAHEIREEDRGMTTCAGSASSPCCCSPPSPPGRSTAIRPRPATSSCRTWRARSPTTPSRPTR